MLLPGRIRAALRPRIRLLAPLVAVLTACGSSPVEDLVPCRSPARPSPGPSPQNTVGPVTVVASGDQIVAQASVDLVATVRGPVRMAAPCDGPAELMVLDHAGLHIVDQTPPAGGEPCGTVALAAGQTARYDVRWTPDSTLPSGKYTAVVTVGDLAPVAVGITLAQRAAEVCAR